MPKPYETDVADDGEVCKQPWSPPQMTEVDTVAVTLSGGTTIADTDPNMDS